MNELKIKDVIDLSKKYKSAREFASREPDVYAEIVNRKWLKYLRCKFPNKWNYEAVKNEAKKYSTRKEFENGCVSAYETARRNKWLDDFNFKECKKPKNYWTLETILQAARNCASYSDFIKSENSAYCVARQKGYLLDVKKIYS